MTSEHLTGGWSKALRNVSTFHEQRQECMDDNIVLK